MLLNSDNQDDQSKQTKTTKEHKGMESDHQTDQQGLEDLAHIPIVHELAINHRQLDIYLKDV